MTNPPRIALSALLLLVFALGGAATANAQNTDTIDISVNDSFSNTSTDETLIANIRDCRAELGATWDFIIDFDSASYTNTDGTRSDYALKIETTSGACSTDLAEDTDTCMIVKGPENIPSTLSVTWTSTFDAFAGLTSPDDCYTKTGTVSLVVVSELAKDSSASVNNDTNNGTTEDGDPIRDRFSVNFRSSRPGAPTGIAATAGEDNVRLSFTAPSSPPDGATYNAYITSTGSLTSGANPEPFEESGVRRVVGSASTSVSIDSGIEVDQTYQVAVVTVDSDGNESVLSEVATITTRPTSDFYELYRNSGGGDQGGFCAVALPPGARAPLSGLAGLGLVGALLLLARRRRRVGAQAGTGAGAGLTALGVAAALSLGAGAAEAQDLQLESRPSGTFEVRLGTYLPQVDEGFSGTGPYEQAFKNESMLLAEVEIERVLWDDVGMLGVAFDFGFMQAVGKALDSDGNRTVDTTVFNIIPLRLAGVYRFDLLTRHLDIPLVLVGKAGIDYYVWWITTGSGSIAKAEGGGGEGFGGTWGWHIAPALHLHLDFFNERSANNLRFDFGIQNSYFFVEYLIAQIDDFGDSDSINLSDSALMFGFAFDY